MRFMKPIPDSRSLMKRSRSFLSFVQALAPNPNRLSFAIRIANDSRFGLGASAWTKDKNERERFINDLESGMGFINRMVGSDPRIPFGGEIGRASCRERG